MLSKDRNKEIKIKNMKLEVIRGNEIQKLNASKKRK